MVIHRRSRLRRRSPQVLHHVTSPAGPDGRRASRVPGRHSHARRSRSGPRRRGLLLAHPEPVGSRPARLAAPRMWSSTGCSWSPHGPGIRKRGRSAGGGASASSFLPTERPGRLDQSALMLVDREPGDLAAPIYPVGEGAGRVRRLCGVLGHVRRHGHMRDRRRPRPPSIRWLPSGRPSGSGSCAEPSSPGTDVVTWGTTSRRAAMRAPVLSHGGGGASGPSWPSARRTTCRWTSPRCWNSAALTYESRRPSSPTSPMRPSVRRRRMVVLFQSPETWAFHSTAPR